MPAPEVAVTDEEVDAAVRLADTLTGDVVELRDEYRDALEEVIAAKAAGTRPAPVGEAPPPASAEVVDLMAMLEKSVQDAKATRGEPATVHPMPANKKASAKKVAKKTTAKSKPRRTA
ncbi:hypothetical protein ACFQ8S_03345 [Streptomyces virginiae]|uniref:hypothetical protein n=1 Tax=Streptomyces virginiae TaxID=1961 RepID=UPI0036915E05